MAARCSFLSTPVALLPSVPSGIAQGPEQIDLLPTPIIDLVEPEGLRNPYPLEEDLIGMEFLPNLCATEHPIGSIPAGACSIGNYFASPSPFFEDATSDALPHPSSLLMPLTSLSSSPSSQFDDHIPRACHGVERRQRSRPSSCGGADYLHFSKLTRHERAAHKTAASRHVAFVEPTHLFASSFDWLSADDAPPSTTALTITTATAKLKRRPPTPRYATSFDVACPSLEDDDDERDASPGSSGFDADVEFEPAEVSQRSPEQVGDKERLTIMVPGGKSEAYVAMAFERSCSLSTEDDDNDDDCPSGAGHQSHDVSDTNETNEKTGLKIRIPVPNPLFMLSLRMASSCRVSDEEEQAEMKEDEGYAGTGTGTGVAAAHTDDDDDDDDEGPQESQSGMTQDQERDLQNHHLNPPLIRAGGFGFGFASSRSPTPPVAPPSSPAPTEGRAERRMARRTALAPYSAIDRLHPVRARERPCLSY